MDSKADKTTKFWATKVVANTFDKKASAIISKIVGSTVKAMNGTYAVKRLPETLDLSEGWIENKRTGLLTSKNYPDITIAIVKCSINQRIEVGLNQLKENEMSYGNEPEPQPPLIDSRSAGHHWLRIQDIDGHDGGLIVLQWQPNAKKWCPSGMYASGHDVDTSNWLYVAPCLMPE